MKGTNAASMDNENRCWGHPEYDGVVRTILKQSQLSVEEDEEDVAYIAKQHFFTILLTEKPFKKRQTMKSYNMRRRDETQDTYTKSFKSPHNNPPTIKDITMILTGILVPQIFYIPLMTRRKPQM
jgi:hypothetical protein